MGLPNNLMLKPKLRRFIEHLLFWLIALALLTFYFGADKHNYMIALRNNLFYLPTHILYFYFLAYYAIPRYLYTRKYAQFFIVLLLSILSIGIITRLIDIFFVDGMVHPVMRRGHNNFFQKTHPVDMPGMIPELGK